jgi:phosphoribosylformylglycinamidine cyclo-ligase
VLPDDADALIDGTSWTPHAEFKELARGSGLGSNEMFSAFNMGIGLIVVAEPDRVSEVMDSAEAAGLEPFECGEVRVGDGGVRLDGI